jgi:predicted Rossmann fold nucleotide-binding protein DprA/Smf involved in DNA uptake
VRAEQKQTQKQSAPKAEKPERTQPDKTDAAKEQPAKEQHVDNSAEVLAQFSDRQREMFAQIPLDKAISADWLVRCGYPAHEVMMALTMFEIKGLISSLPGGLYTRK